MATAYYILSTRQLCWGSEGSWLPSLLRRYQPSSRWASCEKAQWCSAPVPARSLLLPLYAQPSPPAAPGLSLLAQGSVLTHAYSASSCSLWTRFPQNRHWGQASELTWTWLIQPRASQSFQCSLPTLQVPEACCRNSPVTLKLSVEWLHCPWTSPVRSSVLVGIPLQVQQDSLDMSCTFRWYNDGVSCFLPEKQGSGRRKKCKHSTLEQIKVFWLRCVVWHNCFM